MSLKPIMVKEDQLWFIKADMAKLKLSYTHEYIELLIKRYKATDKFIAPEEVIKSNCNFTSDEEDDEESAVGMRSEQMG